LYTCRTSKVTLQVELESLWLFDKYMGDEPTIYLGLLGHNISDNFLETREVTNSSAPE